MKRYKLKKNGWTQRILPITLVVFVGLIALSFITPETAFMSCSEIDQELFKNHAGQIIDMSESTHLQYHEKLDECKNNGYTSNLNT